MPLIQRYRAITLPPFLKFCLRLAVTAIAIWVAFSHVPLGEVAPLLRTTDPRWVAASLVALHIAQLYSAFRTRFYLIRRDIELSHKASLHLHYVGGLFNALLPGSTGGDVYKAWWLKAHAKRSLGNMFLLMLAGRANGLWILGVMCCAMGLFSESIRQLIPFASVMLLLLLVTGSAAYHLLALAVFKESLEHQYTAGWRYSLGVQVLLLVSAWCILRAIGVTEHVLDYLLLFQLSCILSMLPIAIGGIGIRELTLLKGSMLLGFSAEIGLALGLAFSLINLSISLIGAVLYFRFKKPSS